MMNHQLDVWVPSPEFAESIHDQPMPGHRRCNADSKGTRLTQGHPFGAALRLLDVVQDASRIVQKQCPRRTQSDTSGQSIEQEEPQLPLQVSDLPGEGRLDDMEPIGRSSEVLLLPNGDEIPQMSEFH